MLAQQLIQYTNEKPGNFVPGINYNNKFSDKLIACIDCGVGNYVVDLVDSQIYREDTGKFYNGLTEYGRCIQSTTNTTTTINLHNEINSKWDRVSSPFSITAAFIKRSNQTGDTTIFGNLSPSISSFNYYSLIVNGTSAKFGCNPNNINKVISVSGAVQLNEYVILTGTHDGETLKLYKNGVLIGTLAGAGNITPFVASNRGAVIGNFYNYGTVRNFRGEIYTCMLHEKAFFTEEIAELHNNIYQVYSPQRVFYSIAAGGITLLVNNLLNSQTLTQPNITQQHTLPIDNIIQNQTLSNIALTQQHVLAVNNILNSQTLSNITLVIAGTLEVQNITNTQLLSNTGLTQQHILAVNNIVQGQILTQPDLSVDTLIFPNNIINNQTLTNIDLIQQHILNVQNITQSNTLSTPILTQQHVIVVDNLLHSQLLTNINLINGAIKARIHGVPVYILHGNKTVYIINTSE